MDSSFCGYYRGSAYRGWCCDPPTTVRTPHSHTSCRPPPTLALFLATRRNGSAYLARPPSPDSCAPQWPALRQSRNCRYPPDSCRSNRAAPACRLSWRRSSPDLWLTPDLAPVPALPQGSALPLPADTGARCGAPGLLPPTALAECGFPWPRSLPQNFHPPTGAGPAPVPPLHTAARSARTTAQTTSTPETARAGSWRTSSDAVSPDRNPDR